MVIFEASSHAFLSFICCSTGAYIAVLLFSKFLISDVDNFFGILTLSFLIRLAIGVWHFLTFINPNYFNGDTSFNFLWDYAYTDTQMTWLADFRHENGYFTLFPDYYFYINKYAPLHFIMSDLYYFGGSFPLNIAPYNTMFALFSAIAITSLSKFVLNLNARQVKMVLLLAAFFPMGLISSTFFRDIVGQFFIVFGVLIFSVQRKILAQLFFLAIAAFLFFLQRKIYVIVPIVTFLLMQFSFVGRNNGVRKNSPIQNFGLLAALLFTVTFSSSLFSSISDSAIIGQYASADSSYTNSSTSIKFYIFFPFYILKAMIGPFPWTQFFDFREGTILQPQDYLMSCFMYAGVPSLLAYFTKLYNKQRGVTFVFLTAAILMFMGISSGSSMNQTYISIGYFLFIPTIISEKNIYEIFKNFKIVFVFFVLSSILWDLVLKGSDLWGILRI
jgi:hypothetical protein